MKDTLVTFEIAILAKEKGFKELCSLSYLKEKLVLFGSNNQFENYISVPTQSLLQKWLREEHDIDIIIKPWTGTNKGEKMYAADILIFGTSTYIKLMRQNKYEEALERGLYEALKLIKI